MVTASPRPQAHIVFKPPLQHQKKCENCTETSVEGVFTVQYDVERDSNAGELQVAPAGRCRSRFQPDRRPLRRPCPLQVSDGHFVQFFAPSNLPPLRKNIVFVIDVSGSMWGVKMKQVSSGCPQVKQRPPVAAAWNAAELRLSLRPWRPWRPSWTT